MAVIVACHPDDPEGDFPVLAVGVGIDSGYVLEGITYFGREPADGPSLTQFEYLGPPENPENFVLGENRFLRKEGQWFLSKEQGVPLLYPIVYGQNTLEKYGTGEMFAGAQRRFGGD